MYYKVVNNGQEEREGKTVNVFTVEVENFKEPVKGAGLITRSAKPVTSGLYKWYSVEMVKGVPTMQEKQSSFSIDKVLTRDEVEETLRKTIPTAIVVSCDTVYGGIYGMVPEMFNALAVKVERPESQIKKVESGAKE